jgi:hypothetical protein
MPGIIYHTWALGGQIFCATINQNGAKFTKLPLNYQMTIKYKLDLRIIVNWSPEKRLEDDAVVLDAEGRVVRHILPVRPGADFRNQIRP